MAIGDPRDRADYCQINPKYDTENYDREYDASYTNNPEPPAVFVCRPPKQGEMIWNGIQKKIVLCPYDSKFDHWVLEARR